MRRRLPRPLGVLLLLAVATAQERTLTVQNLAPFARREWASAVVPFAKGEVAKLPELHVGAGPTVWQPIGARWPDGSLRQALCLFPIEMEPLSEVELPLKSDKAPPLPDVAILDPVRDGRARVSVHVAVGLEDVSAEPRFVRLLEDNAARKVALYRCRVGGTGILFELVVTSWLGQQHCQVDVGLFFSDPTTKAMQVSVDKVVVRATGMRMVLRHVGPLAMDITPIDGGTDITLLGKATLGDGQGIRRTGVLTPEPDAERQLRSQTLQAAALVPILAATSWRESWAYGPFGFVPEPPPWLRGRFGRTALARRHAAFVQQSGQRGDAFAAFRFGLSKHPGQAGRQEDFGILKLSPVASTGIPSFLLEVELSTLQEACRPVHFFEADGTPLRAKNHPDWVQWDGRTHWNCEVSTDRLGKPCPEPRFESNGWKGKDRQHWSSNYLCGFYLLTGAHWALREIENEVQLFLGGQKTEGATGGPGAARAAGRMLMLGCWLHQCTGDDDLLQRMHDRLEKSHLRFYTGRELGPDKVRILAARSPDPRSLDGKSWSWSPWEESQAVIGYAAFHAMTGDAIALRLGEEISDSVLRYGWVLDRAGAHLAYQVRWNEGGAPLTEQEMRNQDPAKVKMAGGGLAEWSTGAVTVALAFARARGDEAMVAKAERILECLRRGRDRPPKDQWWDEFREWDAVRLTR